MNPALPGPDVLLLIPGVDQFSRGLCRDSNKNQAAWGPHAPKVAWMTVEVQTCSIVLVVPSLPPLSGHALWMVPCTCVAQNYFLQPYHPSDTIMFSGCQPPLQGKVLLRRRQSRDFILISALGLLAALSGCNTLMEMS